MLQDALELHGHAVRLAGAGLAALDLLQREPFDLILCDLGLPGMTGYDFARAVRADPALRQIPLVAATASRRTAPAPPPPASTPTSPSP
jgi:two-component system CheB/CheR fusion protein